MRSIRLTFFLVGLSLVLLLAACAQAPQVAEQATAVPPAAPTHTEESPSPTAVPATATPETAALVEPTAVPATATPEPEPTPTATPEETAVALQPLVEPLPTGPLAIRLTPVVQGFIAPIALADPADETGRLLVADQTGLIYVVTIRPRILDEPFLDLRSRLVTLESSGEARGLLGLALHPDYAENGRFFVHYSAPLRPDGPDGWDHTSHIAEFRAIKPTSDTADPNSERIILQVDHPQSIHNGGQIAFGPDGYLYVSLGDGGVADNAQDTSTLLGKILRLDVDNPDAPYAIPPDNPFVGQSGLDEIFAYGFRNPAHLAFDTQGRLLVSDSGEALWQEMNVVAAGSNYGWPLQDGGQCVAQLASPQLAGELPTSVAAAYCDGLDDDLLRQPVITYANRSLPDGLGTTVVGGSVYQGRSMPTFRDYYIFGDLGESPEAGGRLFAAKASQSDQISWDVEELTVWGQENGRLPYYLRAIGQDKAGEIYLLTSAQPGLTGRSGSLYRLAPEIITESRLVEDATEFLPLPQRYARMFDSVPVYRSPDDIAANNPFTTHGGGHVWVTVYEAAEINGRIYRRIFWDWLIYGWVEERALSFTSPMSRLQGLELQPDSLTRQQLAMAYRPVWVRSEPGTLDDDTIAGYLDPWDLITIYEEREVDGELWYRLGPDQWVHWDYVRLFYEAERPEGVAPGEKWIHVNVTEQTVIAYEGDTPVYASLTATGRRAYPTFTGLYRIYAKVRAGPMRWEDSTPPYNLANVPWIMYFNQDQALHASYWHDLFGSVRSAGCVNLSPHDAYWLFHWATPIYEDGAKVVNSTDENPGTWVFVSE